MQKDLLHLKAPGNWINDPNGFTYYQGKYHLFYQHFPYAPIWGTMHWGHAASEDLVHWEHLGVALFPTKSYDENGVFSGSALEVDGELWLYYSAVKYLKRQEESIHHAKGESFETSQAMITSKDGFHFENWRDKRQIIPVIRDEEYGNAVHTRDPKVWKHGENYYMVLGSTFEKNIGRLLFYESRDAREWKYVSQCRNSNYGTIIECPDLFQINDNHVFVGCPMNIMTDDLKYADQAVCAVVDFQEKTCRMNLPDTFQFVDYGLDLYAPQTTLDEEGRRILIGWMRMPKAVNGEELERPDWNGMMSLPRLVEVENGHICFRVHPRVEAYFSEELEDVGQIDQRQAFWLKADLKEGERLDIGGYQIWVEEDRLRADRSLVFDELEGYRTLGETPQLDGRCELDIFVEPHLIEIFVNGGKYVLSHVVYGLGDKITGNIKQIRTGR